MADISAGTGDALTVSEGACDSTHGRCFAGLSSPLTCLAACCCDCLGLSAWPSAFIACMHRDLEEVTPRSLSAASVHFDAPDDLLDNPSDIKIGAFTCPDPCLLRWQRYSPAQDECILRRQRPW